MSDCHCGTCVECALAIVPGVAARSDFNDVVLAKIHRRRALETCVQLLSEPLVSVSLVIVVTLLWQWRPVAHHVLGWMQSMPLLAAPVVASLSWTIFRCSRVCCSA